MKSLTSFFFRAEFTPPRVAKDDRSIGWLARALEAEIYRDLDVFEELKTDRIIFSSNGIVHPDYGQIGLVNVIGWLMGEMAVSGPAVQEAASEQLLASTRQKPWLNLVVASYVQLTMPLLNCPTVLGRLLTSTWASIAPGASQGTMQKDYRRKRQQKKAASKSKL